MINLKEQKKREERSERIKLLMASGMTRNQANAASYRTGRAV